MEMFLKNAVCPKTILNVVEYYFKFLNDPAYITSIHFLCRTASNPNGVSSLWVGNVKAEVTQGQLLPMFSK